MVSVAKWLVSWNHLLPISGKGTPVCYANHVEHYGTRAISTDCGSEGYFLIQKDSRPPRGNAVVGIMIISKLYLYTFYAHTGPTALGQPRWCTRMERNRSGRDTLDRENIKRKKHWRAREKDSEREFRRGRAREDG